MALTLDQKRKIVERGEHRLKFLESLDLPYVWGGGHQFVSIPTWNRDFDCSGLVSHLLQVMGFHAPTMTTVGLAQWGESGKGKLITIHVKSGGGLSASEEHTIIEWHNPNHERFGESGGYDNPNPAGGPTFFRPTTARVAEFNVKRHPHGF